MRQGRFVLMTDRLFDMADRAPHDHCAWDPNRSKQRNKQTTSDNKKQCLLVERQSSLEFVDLPPHQQRLDSTLSCLAFCPLGDSFFFADFGEPRFLCSCGGDVSHDHPRPLAPLAVPQGGHQPAEEIQASQSTTSEEIPCTWKKVPSRVLSFRKPWCPVSALVPSMTARATQNIRAGATLQPQTAS